MSQSTRSGSRPPGTKSPEIYLVDDQAVLLDLAEAALGSEPYQLRKFLDPEEALHSFSKARTKPVLLVTDYAMGKMNGLELIERCQAIKPDLKSILVSGTAGAEVVLGSQVRVDRYVGKPYHPSSLATLVRHLLEPEVLP